MQKLNVHDIQENPATWQMVQKAVKYCDDRIVEQYEKLEELVRAGLLRADQVDGKFGPLTKKAVEQYNKGGGDESIDFSPLPLPCSR